MNSLPLQQAINYYENKGYQIIPCLDPLIDFIACSPMDAFFVHVYRNQPDLRSFEAKRLPSSLRREAFKYGKKDFGNRISYPQ